MKCSEMMACVALSAGSFLVPEAYGQAQAPAVPPPTIDWSLLRTPDFVGDAMEAYRQGQEIAAQRAAAARARARGEAEAEAEDAERREVAARGLRASVVGQMIGRGDCAGAVSYALNHGDLPLATAARDFCETK